MRLAGLLPLFLVASLGSAHLSAPQHPPTDERLLAAVRAGDVAGARQLLRAGVDANVANEHGDFPLLIAADGGATEMVALLLEHGADPNRKNAPGTTALAAAAWRGHLEICRRLIASGAEVDLPTTDVGNTALHWAAIHGKSDVAEFLLRSGAIVAARNRNGDTPLLLAAANGRAAVVRLLLERGASVSERNAAGSAALSTAAWQGHLDAVRELVRAGAAVDEPTQEAGNTALHWAASYGHDEVVDFLLASGASIEARNRYGDTPLILASFKGEGAVVRLLLERGADPAARTNLGETALEWAQKGENAEVAALLRAAAPARATPTARPQNTPARNADLRAALVDALVAKEWDAVRRLLEAGADPNIVSNGWTPLAIAAREGNLPLLTLLLRLGADPNLRAGSSNRVPLHFAAFADTAAAGALIAALIAGGADVRTVDNRGRSAIDLAVDNGNRAAFWELRRHGGRVSRLGVESGVAGIVAAARAGDVPFLEAQLYRGASVDGRVGGETGLMAAAREGYTQAVLFLLDRGAAVDVANAQIGVTALHWAVVGGHEEIVGHLLARGANPNRTFRMRGRDWSALDVARDIQRQDLVELLTRHGAR